VAVSRYMRDGAGVRTAEGWSASTTGSAGSGPGRSGGTVWGRGRPPTMGPTLVRRASPGRRRSHVNGTWHPGTVRAVVATAR